MKANKYIFIVIIALIQLGSLNAANKAVLIHGFGSDSDTWLDKNTPQQLIQEGIIDGKLMIDYTFGPDQGADVIVTNLINTLAANNVPGVDKWILIGHSLGGLVARAAESELSKPVYDILGIDIVGILTIGTPHQGAPAAAVLANNAQGIVDSWHVDASAGPEVGPSSLVVFSMLMLWNMGLLADDTWQVLLMPAYLDTVKAEAEEWIGLAQDSDAENLLAPYSSLILDLNAASTTAPYKSIIGAERSPTIMRWSSEMSTFFQGSYNELETMDLYDGICDWYSTNANAYDAEADYYEFLCIIICIPYTNYCWENDY